MSPPIAVAVVSWNTRDLLDRALTSLHPAFDAGLAEVWVVDNCSSDGSPGIVREKHPWAKLVEPEENLGFGRAVNLVAERTASPWLAPANADIALTPGALERLLETGRSHPEAGAIAPRLRLPNGKTQHSVYAFPTLTFTALFNLGIHRLSPRLADHLCLEGWWDPDRARVVDWAIGAFLVVRREAWDDAGGFDVAQWMYAEDLDFGWRLARAGWRTLYEPEAHVDHESGASTRQAWGDATTERWMVSTYVWIYQRRGALVGRLSAAMNVLGAGVRWATLVVAAAVNPGRWATRRDVMRAWVGRHRAGLRPPAVGTRPGD